MGEKSRFLFQADCFLHNKNSAELDGVLCIIQNLQISGLMWTVIRESEY